NLATTAMPADNYELRVQDVFAALRQLADPPEPFDLVLADPPFGEKNVGRRSTSLAQQLLDDSHLPRLLAPGALFILGHTKRDALTLAAHWEEVKTLKHGDSMMRFLRGGDQTA